MVPMNFPHFPHTWAAHISYQTASSTSSSVPLSSDTHGSGTLSDLLTPSDDSSISSFHGYGMGRAERSTPEVEEHSSNNDDVGGDHNTTNNAGYTTAAEDNDASKASIVAPVQVAINKHLVLQKKFAEALLQILNDNPSQAIADAAEEYGVMSVNMMMHIMKVVERSEGKMVIVNAVRETIKEFKAVKDT